MASNSQHDQFFTEIVESSSDDNNMNIDESSDDNLEIIQTLSFYPRTLNPEISHYTHPKSDDWVRNILFNYDETRFRRTLRMNKSIFFALVNQIQNHSVFHSNANNIQTDIQIQLAVTLFRLGSLSTIWAISSQFGIAEGTVHLFMDRVTTAIRSLRSKYIKWPQGDYKKEVHKGFQQMQEFSLVIGAIDGSHIPFLQAPDRINKDVYFSRKHHYGIHLQGVVDHKGLFINYDIGWPASVHDAKVFQNSNIYKQSTTFFEGEEYLLGDSAYPLLPFIITPFKVPNGSQKQQQINYNIKHSKTRVVVEQAFGRLKARFLFLRAMKVRDPPKGVEIIETALIIHNFIEKNGDIWGQMGYNDDKIEIQPEEDSELVNQMLDESNLIQKEYAKVKRQNLLELVS
ncbi:194_t:CDS:1 [Cetraspora pellucida]|uniref:194_t:CDS:1 n=1 Tax=Cetraspora pellucida TaxID=1433469 RepID=A0ACA9L9D5_9GLOM|nr:194_t:CDS:1 [Cetraspora pellucida]